MLCPHCGNQLPDDATYCDRCNNYYTSSGPPVPGGYQLDPGSGLYYLSTMGTDPATGAPVQHVTYYNAATGDYSQASYPTAPQPAQQDMSTAIPEGYDFDSASGLYYQSATGYDPQTGAPMQWVTYYNADTGEYNRAAYPLEGSAKPASTPEAQPLNEGTPVDSTAATYAAPDGFLPDESSGLYYQSTDGTDPQTGGPVQWVTYFDPVVTGEYTQASYPLEPQPEPGPYQSVYTKPAPIPPPPDVQSGSSGSKKKILAIVIPFVLLVGLGAATYFFKWYTMLPIFSNDVARSTASGESAAPEPSPEESRTDSDSASLEQSEQAPEEEPEPEATELLYDFPHTSQYYMQIQQDSGHIYMLQPSLYNYRHATLLRMDKGSNPRIENLNNFTNGSYYISGFALVEDDIYFSVPLDDYRSGYYRVHKSGGNAEFLFIQELSHMVPYEGELYFLFGMQGSLGIYNPRTDTLPRLTRLIEEDPVAPPPVLFPEYSIYKGALYYGEYWEDACTYYRMNLQNNSAEVLLSGSRLQESYIFNPLYDGNLCYYDQLDLHSGVNYLRTAPLKAGSSEIVSESKFDPDSGEIIFHAKSGDRLYYQQGANDIMAVGLDNPRDAQLAFTIRDEVQPYGITEEWLFVVGELVRLSDGSRIPTTDAANGPSIDLRDAHSMAQELADSHPEDLAIPR